ncbi:aldehyde dehydrogenase family protein, partial [Glutamicibacter sp. AOP33-2CA-4]|uniref:aldehyde dehydrogenase family protein n=1 Tax=Glutamicibacter sp. AOP33-2CA-4 TaxID=3457690 RepID=UPI004034F098
MNLQPQLAKSLQSNQNPRLHSGETLFIDGSFGPASSAATRQIFCPANGEPVALVSEAGPADAEAAIAAARRAFDTGTWSQLPAPERGDFLLRVAHRLAERK